MTFFSEDEKREIARIALMKRVSQMEAMRLYLDRKERGVYNLESHE